MSRICDATPSHLERQIREAIDEIKDPCSVAASVPMGLVEMGLVESVGISVHGQVQVQLRLTSPFCEMVAYMMRETVARVSALPGVTSVSVTHDSGLEWDHQMIAPEAQARRSERLSKLRTAFEQRTGAQIVVAG